MLTTIIMATQGLDSSRNTSTAHDANASKSQQSETDFRWQGQIAHGRAIEIKGLHGNIRAEAATGDEVEVVATKTSAGSNPNKVQIKVLEHADGVTICAVYPSVYPKQPYECRPGDEVQEGDSPPRSFGLIRFKNNDVQVNFTVRVPPHVRFIGRTIKGNIDVAALRSNVEAYAVNGSIHVATSGYAQARTLNGSIEASLGDANWTKPLQFKTMNGNITVELPSTASTQVRAETFHGDISLGAPTKVENQGGLKTASSTLGDGQRELILSTMRGTINLRRTP
jgi:Putative adhesin